MKSIILVFSLLVLFSSSIFSQNDPKVNYYDFVPDIVLSNLGDSLRLDIDGDGISEYKLFNDWYFSVYQPFVLNLCSNCYYNFNSSVDTIPYSKNFWWQGKGKYPRDSNLRFDGYLGFKIQKSDGLYYGWVKVYVNNKMPGASIIVDKYAYCKMADYSFLYGQTSLSTSVSIDNNKVPSCYFDNSNSTLIIQTYKMMKSVSLISALGTIVREQNMNSNFASLSVIGLVHGTYIVKIQYADNSFYTKQMIF